MGGGRVSGRGRTAGAVPTPPVPPGTSGAAGRPGASRRARSWAQRMRGSRFLGLQVPSEEGFGVRLEGPVIPSEEARLEV